MFKKIVSRISFSPALVAQLGFYAKRLRKEQATRRLGLIFVAMALVVQSLVVFQAPEPANASHPADMIPGGLGWSNPSLKKFLDAYDSNWGHTQHAVHQFGITRAELAAAKLGSFKVGEVYGWGWDIPLPQTRPMQVYDYNGKKVRMLHGRKMNVYYPKTKTIPAFIGHSKKQGWFAISVECGNITTKNFVTFPEPKPAKITATKSAVNVTQKNVNATRVTAKENDVIKYTVTLKNVGGVSTRVTPVDTIKDVLPYANVTSTGGATLNKTKGTLTWPQVGIGAGGSTTRTYTVKMKSNLAIGKDACSMTNTFFDKKVTVKVGCYTPPPPPKEEPAPAKVVANKSAINTTQGNVNATRVAAKEKDVITYTVTLENTGGTSTRVTPVDTIKDVLAYATVTNTGGATLNKTAGTLTWPAQTLAPGAKITKTYTVTMLDSLALDKDNCSMTNTFFDKNVTVKVDCYTPEEEEVPVIELDGSKTATNITQGNVDATTVVAKASDRITHTLTVENKGNVDTEFTFEDNISDTLEYATLLDNGGGRFDEDTKTLLWPAVTLKPGAKEVRTFTVQLHAEVPATPTGASNGTSYNCRMENGFRVDEDTHGTATIIEVDCPAPKVIVEQTVTELPQTGAGANIAFGGTLLAVVAFFYFRSRQLGTEVRLVRRNISEGVF